MTQLKDILKSFASIADKAPEKEYDNIWLQRSKQDENNPKKYINQTTNMEVLSADKTDEFVYNVWAKMTEDGLADMDKFVEEELLPRSMRLLQQTQRVSGDGNSVRYMIARNITE